jgi:hypothetical protein
LTPDKAPLPGGMKPGMRSRIASAQGSNLVHVLYDAYYTDEHVLVYYQCDTSGYK